MAVASAVLFYILAAVILISAFMMVSSKDLVHSALLMVVTFVGVAGIYVLLYADFLAVVQIMVYIGAISILLVFGVMLTRRGNMGESNLFNRYRLAAGLVSAALFAAITRFIFLGEWVTKITNSGQSTVDKISDLLLSDYVVPFEVAGVLLLVALVGAIIIGKGESKPK